LKVEIVRYQSLGLLSKAKQSETTWAGEWEANNKRKDFQLRQKHLKNQNNQSAKNSALGG